MDQRLLRILGGNMAEYPDALEAKYPRVFSQIMALWDLPEIDDYFMDLMVDRRGGRAGFPDDVAAQIVHLSLVHTSQHSSKQSSDVWDISSSAVANVPATPEAIETWRNPPVDICNTLDQMGIAFTSTGFMHSAETGNRPAIGLFLEAGVHPQLHNDHGMTALMLAAQGGHAETVALLLKYQADVYITDQGGNTALHWAAYAGQVDSAQVLIEHHADIDKRNIQGCTPLMQAVTQRQLSMVLLLINCGANLDIVSSQGNSPLHKAAAAGYKEIIRPLLEQGAALNIRNVDGDTAVKLAVKNGQEAVVRMLLAAQEQRMDQS